MDTSEMICYDIRSFFQESPQLRLCPRCCHALDHKDVKNSASGMAFRASATIPLVETTVYTCKQCGWWAVREVRIDCELCDGIVDQIVTARDWPLTEQIMASPQVINSGVAPWEKVLQNRAVWADCQRLPARVAKYLFGCQEAGRKQKNTSQIG